MVSPLKAITQNLPAIIRDPAIALIGQECYTTLIYNLDFGDTRCLRLALSKVLGVGIVVGGGIVKVPQILMIVKHRSTRGVSLSSYFLDTASLLLTVGYNARLNFPFSTYGENIALAIQNIIIIVLIFYYSQSRPTLSTARGASRNSPWPSIITFVAAIAAATFALSSESLTPIPLLRTLVALSIPLSLSAKVPQIVVNARNHSTGQLSAFLVFNSLAGCVARLFTTSTETGDATLWWGFFSAAALNGVIAAQMAYYWNQSHSTEPLTISTIDEKNVVQVPLAPSPKLGTLPRIPPNRTTSPPNKPVSAARWQRKAE